MKILPNFAVRPILYRVECILERKKIGKVDFEFNVSEFSCYCTKL